MAISATFEAHFGSFFEAVDQAVAKLGDVERAAATVGPRLDRMVASFSGDKVIQDAALMVKAIDSIGGVSRLTEKELANVAAKAQEAAAKIRALGGDVPPALQKIADAAKPVEQGITQVDLSFATLAKTLIGGFGIQQAIGFAKQFATEIFNDADALMKLHDKTGVSMQSLQKFQIAGDDAGNTIEDITGAIVKMEDKLSSGDRSAFQALVALKIPFEDIKNLKPENQFIAISDALRQVQDPALQVKLAMDLFGKSGAEVLPTLKRGFDDLKGASVGMSDATIQNLDSVADTTGKWYRATKGFLANLTVDFGHWVQDGLDPATHAVRNMQRAALEAQQSLKAMIDAIPPAPKNMAVPLPAITFDSASVQRGIREMDALQEATDKANAKARKAIDDYNASIKKITDTLSGGEVIDKALELQVALQHTIPIYQMTQAQQDAINKTMGEAIAAYHAMGTVATDEMYRVYQATERPIPIIQDVSRLLTQTAVDTMPLLARQTVSAMGQAVTGMQGLERAGVSLRDRLTNTLRDIPTTIIAAFTGGGGMSGAIVAIATQLGKDFADTLSANIAEQLKQNKILPGSGGSLFNATNLGLAGASGIMAGVGTAASGGSMGQSIGAAAGMGMSVAAIGGLTTASIALGAATFGIGTAAVFAYYGIKHLIDAAADRRNTNELRESFIDLTGGFEAANQAAWRAGASLDALLAARNTTEATAALQELQAAFEFQTRALNDVNDTAQKYGFTLEELGPALQRQELDSQAQTLFHDFEVLNAAGIDTVAIVTRMGAATSEYIQTAVKMGVEVPSAMRPMLEEMVRAGTLTDANGDKITDLEDAGVHFSLTMTEGFKQMIASVDKLAEVISRSLGVSLDDTANKIKQIPKNVDVSVNVTENVTRSAGSQALEGFQGGTDGFRNFGKGTPVMLHGWEAVIPREAASQGGGALPAGGGGPTIIINAQGAFFDTPESQQRLADKVSAALTSKYGLSNKYRAA